MSGLFEGIGSAVGGVIGGGASGVVQGLPGGIAGGVAGGALGAATGAGVGAAAGAVTGGVTIPITEAGGIAGGALIGSAGGAAAGFAPGFSQGYGAGYGPGAAVGGGYGQGLDQTWLGQKLNAMVKGHEQVEGKGKEADQKKACGTCKETEEEKNEKRPPNKSPEGADRDEALAAAKKANNIPDDLEPDIKPNYGKNPTEDSPPVSGSENLGFLDNEGNEVTIRHDYDGHGFPDNPTQSRGPHFNDPSGNHYDYNGQPSPFGPLRRR